MLKTCIIINNDMIKTNIKSYCLFSFLTVVNVLCFSPNLSFQKKNGNLVLKSALLPCPYLPPFHPFFPHIYMCFIKILRYPWKLQNSVCSNVTQDRIGHVGVNIPQLQWEVSPLFLCPSLTVLAWDICLCYVFSRPHVAVMSWAVSAENVPKGLWICRMQQDKMNRSI